MAGRESAARRPRAPPACPTGGGGSAVREGPAESCSFPRLPPQLPPDLPPALPGFPRPEHRGETGRAGNSQQEPAPSALLTPAPRRLARRRRGVPARGTATAAGCPFTPPSTCSPLLFGNGGGEEVRQPLPVVRWARVPSRARPRGDSGLTDVLAAAFVWRPAQSCSPLPPPPQPGDRAAGFLLSGRGERLPRW